MQVKKRLLHHRQAYLSSMQLLVRTPVATLMTILVIAVTLIWPLIFFALKHGLESQLPSWSDGQQIQVYLKMPLSEAAQQAAFLRIQNIEGVQSARLISPAQGMALLQQDPLMRESLATLSENPLPAVIEVTPAESTPSPEQRSALGMQLQQVVDVEHVQLDMQWVSRLIAIIQCVGGFMQITVIVLGIGTLMIIGNTLRLALYTRREEVLVLKLLGASDAYIVRPFLYSGLLFGLCGVVLALGMAQWVCFRLQPLFSHVFSLYEVHFQGVYVPWIDVMYVAGFALLLGWLGALLAVKRQLASIAALE